MPSDMGCNLRPAMKTMNKQSSRPLWEGSAYMRCNRTDWSGKKVHYFMYFYADATHIQRTPTRSICTARYERHARPISTTPLVTGQMPPPLTTLEYRQGRSVCTSYNCDQVPSESRLAREPAGGKTTPRVHFGPSARWIHRIRRRRCRRRPLTPPKVQQQSASAHFASLSRVHPFRGALVRAKRGSGEPYCRIPNIVWQLSSLPSPLPHLNQPRRPMISTLPKYTLNYRAQPSTG